MGGYGSGRYGLLGEASKRTVESCLDIDVNRWNRGGWLKPGRSFNWHWTAGDDKSSITVIPNDNSLVLSYTVNGEDVRYGVSLTRTHCNYGNTRPWLVCPGCERRVGKLYLREKYFLCRHCQELTYESCQTSGKFDERMARKAHKIKGKLGVKGATGLMDGIWPDKPKYMHRKTYYKLQMELLEVQEAGVQAIVSSFGLTVDRLKKASGR